MAVHVSDHKIVDHSICYLNGSFPIDAAADTAVAVIVFVLACDSDLVNEQHIDDEATVCLAEMRSADDCEVEREAVNCGGNFWVVDWVNVC